MRECDRKRETFCEERDAKKARLFILRTLAYLTYTNHPKYIVDPVEREIQFSTQHFEMSLSSMLFNSQVVELPCASLRADIFNYNGRRRDGGRSEEQRKSRVEREGQSVVRSKYEGGAFTFLLARQGQTALLWYRLVQCAVVQCTVLY